MVDELWWANLEEGWWWVRQDLNKVTEEAVRRVQEDQKKAQQIGQQIQDDHKSNLKLAQFLSFLIADIKDDNVIKWVYDTFFKVKHPETDIVYLKKNINTIVIVGVFVPFYIDAAQKAELTNFYEDFYDFKELALTDYVHYLKKLSGKYHDNVPLDKEVFLNFLIDVVWYYNLVDLSTLNNESRKELKATLSKELYW